MIGSEHVAYDYDKQEWVEGEPARKLLIEQAELELDLFRDPVKCREIMKATGRTGKQIGERILNLYQTLHELKDPKPLPVIKTY